MECMIYVLQALFKSLFAVGSQGKKVRKWVTDFAKSAHGSMKITKLKYAFKNVLHPNARAQCIRHSQPTHNHTQGTHLCSCRLGVVGIAVPRGNGAPGQPRQGTLDERFKLAQRRPRVKHRVQCGKRAEKLLTNHCRIMLDRFACGVSSVPRKHVFSQRQSDS